MTEPMPKEMTIPVGVVLRRAPGVTRWAEWAWSVAGVLPGAGPGGFRVLREEAGVTEFHAATVQMELHHTEVASYRVSLMMRPPSVFVVLNLGGDAGNEHGIGVHLVTANADLAQNYQDSGEVRVEPVAMPEGLTGTVRAFCDAHYVEVPFKKRKRDRVDVTLVEDGIGDPRIRQAADVYRSPGSQKAGKSDG